MGVVGEVAGSWGLPDPPAVLVQADPPVWADAAREPNAAHTAGPLRASQVRPIETLRIGPLSLPLAVNTYTGGLPDWPSRLLYALTGSLAAVETLHLLYGALIVVVLWRILRLHGAVVAGGAGALWLATDWTFLFYRRVLGGTEAWLLLASLLLAHGVWDRRWRGGATAPWAVALGIGIGLHAKITFVAVLLGVVLATLLTRWDRGPFGEPSPVRRRTVLGAIAIALLPLVPLIVANLHQAWVPEPHLRSHDFVGLQSGRLLQGMDALWTGDWAPSRESPANLASFLVQPLGFFTRACGADPIAALSMGRVAGWAIVLAGTVLAWRERDDGAPGALLRWLSVAVPSSAVALFLLNRDMHHLAVLSALTAVWAGLAIDRLASLVTPPRSTARARACALLLLPWIGAGAWSAWRTDAVLETCEAPVILRQEQQAIARMLREHEVQRVVVVDYDLYGALDMLAPEIDVINGWGAMSVAEDRRHTLGQLLELAIGGHYLTVRQSAATIYGTNPSERDLERVAEAAGLTLEPVARREDERGPTARLYRVRKRE